MKLKDIQNKATSFPTVFPSGSIFRVARFSALMGLAVGVALIGGPIGAEPAPHPSGGKPETEVKSSAKGHVQQDEKKAVNAAGAQAMGAAEKIQGTTEPHVPVKAVEVPANAPGHQIKLEKEVALRPAMGQGQQKAPPGVVHPGHVDVNPGATHLAVTLRLTKGGGAEVLRAVEVPGEHIANEAPSGTYIYEITHNGTSIAAQSISDPFLGHDFGGPPGTPNHRMFHVLDTADIVVKVPNVTLASLKAPNAKLAVKVFQISHETRLTLTKVNPEVVAKLSSEKKLTLESHLDHEKLVPALHAKTALFNHLEHK